MEQRLWMILQLFGGAALFLYSMDTLTDALQQAAGDTLRQALARLTAHPLAGVLTGAAVTAVVQSSSAVTVLDPQPGEKVLDLCAAPGGKSTQIAGLLAGEGLLWSNEIVKSRAQALLSNVERLGVANAVVSSCHPQRL